jgi:hypothetical protein
VFLPIGFDSQWPFSPLGKENGLTIPALGVSPEGVQEVTDCGSKPFFRQTNCIRIWDKMGKEMVDIAEIAKESGLMLRTLLTQEAWQFFSRGGQIQGRDLKKRLSRMLVILHIALTQRKGLKEKMIHFSAPQEDRGSMTNKLILIAAVETNACGQSVITIMLPGEKAGERYPKRRD